VPRRVSLPAADELFRTTGGSAVQPSAPQGEQGAPSGDEARVPAPGAGADREAAQEHPQGDAADGDAGARAVRGRGGVPGQNPGPDAADRRRAGAVPQAPQGGRPAAGARTQAGPARRGRAANRRPSGRERHDEKITVYVSAEELMDLEHARLVLRGEHGLAVDRGRIVREAVAVVLADLEARGDASILVRRLRGR
jgi:hypothetical protein